VEAALVEGQEAVVILDAVDLVPVADRRLELVGVEAYGATLGVDAIAHVGSHEGAAVVPTLVSSEVAAGPVRSRVALVGGGSQHLEAALDGRDVRVAAEREGEVLTVCRQVRVVHLADEQA